VLGRLTIYMNKEEPKVYNILDEYINAYAVEVKNNTWEVIESSAKIYGGYYNATIKRENKE